MGTKYLRISRDLLIPMLSSGEHHFKIEGMPKDAKIVAVMPGESYERPDTIYLYVSSKEFPETPTEEALDVMYLTVTTIEGG